MCYVCNYACLHTTKACEKIKMVLTDFQFPINIQINVTQSQKRAMTWILLRIVGVKAHFTHCKQVRMWTFTDSSNVYNQRTSEYSQISKKKMVKHFYHDFDQRDYRWRIRATLRTETLLLILRIKSKSWDETQKTKAKTQFWLCKL